ncbi:hypothetical protein SPRA44_690006 [Serratia proteamaculans]|nr:hypothetical protein SPRA44_690006 [Serratia proteamaculans]
MQWRDYTSLPIAATRNKRAEELRDKGVSQDVHKRLTHMSYQNDKLFLAP